MPTSLFGLGDVANMIRRLAVGFTLEARIMPPPPSTGFHYRQRFHLEYTGELCEIGDSATLCVSDRTPQQLHR